LSGGERARVLIARLMLQPADVLILDEPTNDLDIPTLEVLEESLVDFPGGLVLVTRDRFLLDRVSTVVLALDGAGGASFFADSAQWEAAQASSAEDEERLPMIPVRPAVAGRDGSAARPGADVRRLTYLEKREWVQMEQAILEAEDRVATCRTAVDDPGIAADPVALRVRWQALEEAQGTVDRLYERWAELEAKHG
jgi:ABC transport system ATP-binding/permease protein